MVLFLSALVAGIGIGAVYGLIALSYTVVFSSTAIFNVAQGDLMMAGVLTAYYCLDEWHLNMGVTLLAILAVVLGLSLIEERIAVRPFISRPGHGIGWFISTLAFSLGLEITSIPAFLLRSFTSRGDRPRATSTAPRWA